MDFEAYSLALENIIMDELLPMYLVGCRSSGKAEQQNPILIKLMAARREASKQKICALLDKNFSSVGVDY